MVSKKRTVSIVGAGHVGRLTNELFPDAAVYDKYLKKFSSSITRDAAASSADICFVCVPTPGTQSGSADISIVQEVCSWLKSDLVVIRSTVPPGTTESIRDSFQLRTVCWPEYIGQWEYPSKFGAQLADWPFVLVGGHPDDTRELVEILAEKLGPEKTYRQSSAVQVELAKYMENSWLAVQAVFAREFRLLADNLDVDYWELRELWSLDPRVSKAHTVAVRSSSKFGGTCLPKDLAAIIAVASKLGFDLPLLEAALTYGLPGGTP